MYELLFFGQKIKLPKKKKSTILEEHNNKNQ